MEYFAMPACEAVPADWDLQDRTREAHRAQKRQPWWDWYSTYLSSPAWADKRREVLTRDRNKCLRCSAPATQVHHMTYQNVGYENLDELASVCDACHEWVHGS